MRRAPQIIGVLWYIYILSSWSIMALVFGYKWPQFYLYIVVVAGIVLFILKLYYVNDLPIWEINFRTILFDLAVYAYAFLIGVAIWKTLYVVWETLDPQTLHRYFPNLGLYQLCARRMILTGSSSILILFVMSGGNKPYTSLMFTNKVHILEPVIFCIALSWVAIDIRFVGLLVSSLFIVAMPRSLKSAIMDLVEVVLNKKIDLIGQDVENNEPDPTGRLQNRTEYFWNFVLLLITPIISGLLTHLPLALLALGSLFVFQTPAGG